MKYWVIQVVRGAILAIGPYSSEDARDRRYSSVKGGEVVKFNSYSSDSKEVIEEFRKERNRRVYD